MKNNEMRFKHQQRIIPTLEECIDKQTELIQISYKEYVEKFYQLGRICKDILL